MILVINKKNGCGGRQARHFRRIFFIRETIETFFQYSTGSVPATKKEAGNLRPPYPYIF
ncbi:hypothetical protein [Eisenbergiella porci]|uniref:hypothetical protein n=1 Tax=Eisenbergiella porci TaxID=2652274 RepID=UPI0022E07E39|nr:hypothetical protein [Eisenbergiella porci]